jgi:RNA-directed DNA polymerase
MRKGAAVGVDGVTKEQYGQDLERNLRDLHERLVAKRYRHQPIRRVHIPKERGKTRPIGVSAFEDKLVQDAVREVLEAIYEQDFLPCSYGFRPGRSAHDALRALDHAVHLDSVDRKALVEMLQARGRRRVAAAAHRQVLARGCARRLGVFRAGAGLYLHYALDSWFEREVKPRLRGKAILVRYCDDFVMGFEREDDAQRVMAVLGKRLERFGLTLHPEKTRLLPFRRPPASRQSGKGSATFDFLGFTLFMGRTRRDRWMMWCKTRSARLRRRSRPSPHGADAIGTVNRALGLVGSRSWRAN